MPSVNFQKLTVAFRPVDPQNVQQSLSFSRTSHPNYTWQISRRTETVLRSGIRLVLVGSDCFRLMLTRRLIIVYLFGNFWLQHQVS
jgi:hypothetical protein